MKDLKYNLIFRRVAAIFLIVGSAAVLVFRGLHGDLPAGDAHAAMQFIVSHPFYKGVHLGAVVGVMLSVIGFVAFSFTLTDKYAATVSWLATAIMLVGAAVHIVEHTIDGHAGQTLAGLWHASSHAEQANIEHSAGTVFVALHGPALVSVSMLWGFSVLLFARAAKLENYPSWFYWSGLAAGSITFISALSQYLHPDLIPGFLIFGMLVFLVQLWTILLGFILLRQGKLDS
ncbi:hypothetical protein [Paenibacillus thermotolerans]|uniref:hypothetical protein n=1 Tax=Paenibacillus thermotolerans TaxID=3027807 RepID=UPI002367A5D7|nr:MULTISPECIES: hypothetical protein [unclassified Paenibacillus]